MRTANFYGPEMGNLRMEPIEIWQVTNMGFVIEECTHYLPAYLNVELNGK